MENDHEFPRHQGDGPPPRRGRHDIVDDEQTAFLWPEAEDLRNDGYAADLPRAGDYRLSALADPFDQRDPQNGLDGWPSRGGSPAGPAGDLDRGSAAGLFEPRMGEREPRISPPADGLFAERPAPEPPAGNGAGLFPPRHDPGPAPAFPSDPPQPDPGSAPPDPYAQREPYGPSPDPYAQRGPYGPSPDPYAQREPYGPSPDPYAQPAHGYSVESRPTVAEPWSAVFPGSGTAAGHDPSYGPAPGGAPTFLERSTVVDPQHGAPAGSTFHDGYDHWQDYGQADDGYTGGYGDESPGQGRNLLSDQTDPSMPYPAAMRSPDNAYQYPRHNPGPLATLLDLSDRRWFTAALTGGLVLVLAGIVWAAFSLGSSGSGPESILAASTVPNLTTSSVPEGSAGAATTETSTVTAVDDSSSASIRGTVVTSESTTTESTEASTTTTEETTTTSTTSTSTTAASVSVPDVGGMGRLAATGVLEAAGLGVRVTERRVPVGSGQNALVIDQNPNAGASVAPGTVVTIVIAQESSNQGN